MDRRDELLKQHKVMMQKVKAERSRLADEGNKAIEAALRERAGEDREG